MATITEYTFQYSLKNGKQYAATDHVPYVLGKKKKMHHYIDPHDAQRDNKQTSKLNSYK